MKLRLLRNATLKLEIRGRIVLIDPFFAPKGSRPSFTGRAPNPLVELPVSPEEILDGVELVVVSHLHADHFDPVAQSLVPTSSADLPAGGRGQDPVVRVQRRHASRQSHR